MSSNSLHEPKINKLGEKRIECIFIGYVKNSKAYWFLVIESNSLIEVNIVIEPRDAIFYENKFSIMPKLVGNEIP